MFFGLAALDWAVLVAYFVVITAIGWVAVRRVRSSSDYFVGGRKFGKGLSIAQAFGAGTQTDQAVIVIGTSSQLGFAGIWYQWLYLFATPFFWLIAPLYRRTRYTTLGDFFTERFGRTMGALYTVVGLIFVTVEIGTILKAVGVTIEGVTRGAISTNAAVLGMTAFFLIYGLLGGLVAAARTQFVQGFLILLLSFLLIPFAIAKVGGLGVVAERLGPEMFQFVAMEEVTLFFIVMSVLNGLVGITVYPHHMVQNGAGQDELASRAGWTFGTFIKRFATLGWAITGLCLAAVFPMLMTLGKAEREQAFGLGVTELLPVGFVGLMIAAMVAGAVAASNSFMVNGAALITRDLYQRFVQPDATEVQKLWVGRFSAALVVALGVGIALLIPSVIDGLLLIWKVTAFLGIAFWGAVIWRRCNRYGAWAAVLVSTACMFWAQSQGWTFPEQVALYLPAGILAMIAVSLLTKPEPERQLNIFYSLLNTPAGEEARLFQAGIPMIDPGKDVQPPADLPPAPATPPLLDDEPAARRGESLLLTNLLRLRDRFSLARYRVDLGGFGLSWAIVAGYLVLAFVVIQWMRSYL